MRKNGMRSGFEHEVSKLLRRKKVKFQYETHTLAYLIERKYTPDFVIELPGLIIYLETKGFFTSADRTKMKAVKDQHPDKEIKLWFQKDNYLTKKKKDRYSDWARKNGFDYHVGTTFPSRWFK